MNTSIGEQMSYYPGMYEDEQMYNDEQAHAEMMAEMNERTLEMMMMDDSYAQLMDPDYYS